MASLQLFSQLLNERKKCALSPSKPQLLALFCFPLSEALLKGPGWLLVALGDLVAAAGLWGRAQHPSPSSGCPSPEFFSSFSAGWSPCSWQSIAVTSSARHQPDVTGTGSAGGPPTQEPYQPRGWRAQVTPRAGRPPLSLFSRHKTSPRWKFQSWLLTSSAISAGQEEGPALSPQ